MKVVTPRRDQRRTKWEAFWRTEQVAAEATHRISVQLALGLLKAAGLPPAGLRVLDLGCGAGRVMELLQAHGCTVTGVDLAFGALQAARSEMGPTARLIQADAFQLALASQSFDAVLSLGYASVGSYPGVQNELSRVLRTGGVALIDFRRFGLYHLPLLPWRGGRFLAAWRRGDVSLPLLGLHPAVTWTAAGFRLEAVRLFNTYPPLGRWLRPETCVALEGLLSPRLAPVLARTALTMFRKERGCPPFTQLREAHQQESR